MALTQGAEPDANYVVPGQVVEKSCSTTTVVARALVVNRMCGPFDWARMCGLSFDNKHARFDDRRLNFTTRALATATTLEYLTYCREIHLLSGAHTGCRTKRKPGHAWPRSHTIVVVGRALAVNRICRPLHWATYGLSIDDPGICVRNQKA